MTDPQRRKMTKTAPGNLSCGKKEGRVDQDNSLMPKEGIFMRILSWLPAFSTAALAILSFGSGNLQAGSWFGPCCYGADYAYQYPNRAHNYFGCGPGQNCSARHPLFRHHWLRKNQAAPANGGPVNAAPFEYAPAMPAPVATAPFLPAPVANAPVVAAPVMSEPAMAFSPPVQSAPVQPAPASSRIEPIPQPLPAGSSVPATPTANSSAKPPF
jgi:hypothetical protein